MNRLTCARVELNNPLPGPQSDLKQTSLRQIRLPGGPHWGAQCMWIQAITGPPRMEFIGKGLSPSGCLRSLGMGAGRSQTTWRCCSSLNWRRACHPGGHYSDFYPDVLSLCRILPMSIFRSSHSSGLILGLRPANVRRRYFVTTSLIGWEQT